VTLEARRLHGVLLADMTGFSRLMGQDESRAVAALMRVRSVFTAVVPRHGGTLDVLVGDCFVALFDSAAEAVRAAIAIQTELGASGGPARDPVRIRIGVHLGDVVRSGAEILGDSVNVAARLQTIARPGAIAVSEDVYRAVRNRVSLPFRDLGPKALKNIQGKMRVYELHPEEAHGPGERRARSMRPVALAAGVVLTAGLALVAHRLATRETPGVGPATSVFGLPPTAPSPTPPANQVAATPTAEQPLTVGVTGVSAQGDVPGWMQDNTRDGLNTLLSKVERLRVFSREKIDFLRQRRGLSEIEVAEMLGIQKMISGTVALDDGDLVLEARVVDIATGLLDGSESARGEADALIELQNELAVGLLAALRVPLSDEERTALFARRTRETLDSYRRLADTFGEASGGPPPRSGRSSWLAWPRAAWASGEDAAEPAIRAALEAYRAALEQEDLEAVAATHVALGSEQRTGFERYFEATDDLRVEVNDVDVLQVGGEALVTFTRRDVFRDHESGKQVELEVRLSSEVVLQDDRWLLRGVKRP
jgi:adenylate cyclase